MTKERYARKCDNCSKGMNEGWVWGDGEGYACSDKCLYVNGYTSVDMNRDFEEDIIYHTAWDECDIDDEYYTADGECVPVEQDNNCCKYGLEFDMDGDTDGVEYETWKCADCKSTYNVPIEIVRNFDDITIIKKGQDND